IATNGIDISGGKGGVSNNGTLIGGPGSQGFYLLQVACSGTPAPGSPGASPSSVCAATTGAPAGSVLSLPSLPAAVGYTYQWKVSGTSGSGYANVASGGTGATYTTPTTLPNTPTSFYIC